MRRFLLRLLGARTDNCGCNCGCVWCQSWDEDVADYATTTSLDAHTDLSNAKFRVVAKGGKGAC